MWKSGAMVKALTLCAEGHWFKSYKKLFLFPVFKKKYNSISKIRSSKKIGQKIWSA